MGLGLNVDLVVSALLEGQRAMEFAVGRGSLPTARYAGREAQKGEWPPLLGQTNAPTTGCAAGPKRDPPALHLACTRNWCRPLPRPSPCT